MIRPWLCFTSLLLILSLLSCAYFTESKRTYSRHEEKLQTDKPYRVSVERTYEAEGGPVVIITAIAEEIRGTYNKYEHKTTSYKADWLKVLFWAPLVYVALESYSKTDTATLAEWVIAGVAAYSIIYVVTRNYKPEKKTILTESKEKSKETTRPIAAFLQFRARGTPQRIMLGKFEQNNQLRVNLNELLKTSGYPFQDLEEVNYYLAHGEIIITWENIPF